MIPAELLRKKRDGVELSREEISWFIQGITTGYVSEAQAAAFLMAACTKGLSPIEISALAQAMTNSGKRFNFRSIAKPISDKHSTGGVGDKISLLLAPLAAAAGLAVPMISGRGLGHTGGTVDKLESITNFVMDYKQDELLSLLEKNGVFMTKQTADIAPADKVLYHLRDVTGTVESVGLITASILSKKIAEDLDTLVIDMKVGKGAFMPTFDDAKRLAESMMSVAAEANLTMSIVFTRMEEPLGNAIGNWLEVDESIQSLKNFDNTPTDIREITLALTAEMMYIGKLAQTPEAAYSHIEQEWRSGKGYELFELMVQAQSGSLTESYNNYANTPILTVHSPTSGFVTDIHARETGVAGIMLGAGRLSHDDILDYSAGIILHKKVGDAASSGEPLATLYCSDETKFSAAADRVLHAITIGTEQPAPVKHIIDIWRP